MTRFSPKRLSESAARRAVAEPKGSHRPGLRGYAPRQARAAGLPADCRPAGKWFAAVAGLLLAACSGAALAAAEGSAPREEGVSAAPAGMRFRRVFAPADRLSQWPLGQIRYLRMEPEQFEQLARAASSPAAQPGAAAGAFAKAARYEARLIDGRLLSGFATLEVGTAGPAPTILTLEPCNLAISGASWNDTAAEGRPEERPAGNTNSADQSSPQSANSRGTAASGRSGFLGFGPSGALAVHVEQPGRLEFNWSLRGQPGFQGSLEFELHLPRCPTNTWVLELPENLVPTLDEGIVLEEDPAEEPIAKKNAAEAVAAEPVAAEAVGAEAVAAESLGAESLGAEPVAADQSATEHGAAEAGLGQPGLRRWRLELGGRSQVRLRLQPAGQPAERWGVMREFAVYELSQDGLRLAVDLALEVHEGPLRQIALAWEGPLQLVEVLADNQPARWTMMRAEEQRRRAVVELPDAWPQAAAVLHVRALAPLQLEQPWRLPRIELEGAAWQEGVASLRVGLPLVVRQIALDRCRQTASGPLGSQPGGESLQFQYFAPSAGIEVELAEQGTAPAIRSATNIDLRDGETTARVVAELNAGGAIISSLEAEVGPQWLIQSVQSVPPEALDDWVLQRDPGGRRYLSFVFARPLPARSTLRIVVSARQLRWALSRPLGLGDLVPLHFTGLAGGRHLVAVRTPGPYQLEPAAVEPMRLLSPEQLDPSERALFAEPPTGLLFEDDPRVRSWQVVLRKQQAGYQATIQAVATVAGNQLREQYLLRIAPQGSPVEHLRVRFFPAQQAPVGFRLGAGPPNGPPLRAVRETADARQPGPASEETWLLVLPRAQEEPFEIHALRESEIRDRRPLSLAWLPDAADQQARLIVRADSPDRIRTHNLHLEPTLSGLPEPGQYSTICAAYRYEPGRSPAEAAVEVARLPHPATVSAWVWNAHFQSWYQTDGRADHLATYWVEAAGRSSLLLRLPAGVASGQIQHVLVDRQPASWQTSGGPPGDQLSIELPPARRFPVVEVWFTTRGRPLGTTGRCVAPLLLSASPVLAQTWSVWLPPGYRAVGGPAGRLWPECPAPGIRQRLFGPLARPVEQAPAHPLRPSSYVPALGQWQKRAQAAKRAEQWLTSLGESAPRPGEAAAGDFGRLLASLPPRSAGLLIDCRAMEEVGLRPGQPLPLLAGRTAADRGLELLRKYDLSLIVGDEVLVLTSRRSAALLRQWLEPLPLRSVFLLKPGPLAEQVEQAAAGGSEGLVPANRWPAAARTNPVPWPAAGAVGMSEGWTVCQVVVSAEAPTELAYVRTDSLRLWTWVALLGLGGTCWWLNRLYPRWLCWVLAGTMCAALLIPEPATAVATGATLGALSCCALWLAHTAGFRRGWPEHEQPGLAASKQESSATGKQEPAAAGKQESSATGKQEPSGAAKHEPAAGGKRESSAAGKQEASGAGQQQASASHSSDSARGRHASGAQRSLPGEDSTGRCVARLLLAAAFCALANRAGAAENSASAPLGPGPVYQVFIPIDENRQPTGDRYFVPEPLYRELFRHRAGLSEGVPEWLLGEAVYRAVLSREALTGKLRVDELKASFALRVFAGPARVQIPFRRAAAGLLPDGALLDGRLVPVDWEAGGNALVFDVAQPGEYRLELALRPVTYSAAEWGGFDLAIPPLAASRVELVLPAGSPAVEVPGALGAIVRQAAPPQVVAHLGPCDKLSVRWASGSAAAIQPAADVEQLIFLRVEPGTVVVETELEVGVAEGAVDHLRLSADPGLRLLPLVAEPSAARAELESVPEGPQRVVFRWPEPISQLGRVRARFLWTDVAGIGRLRLPLLAAEQARTIRRWVGVSVDPALEYQLEGGQQWEAVEGPELLARWGRSGPPPTLAGRLSGDGADWTLTTQPRMARTTAQQSLVWTFDEGVVELACSAELNTVSGSRFEYRLSAPPGLEVIELSVQEDGLERLGRFCQQPDGTITLFLNAPAAGRQHLTLKGRLRVPARNRLTLPVVQLQGVHTERLTIELSRRAGVMVEVKKVAGLSVLEAASTGAAEKRIVALYQADSPNLASDSTSASAPYECVVAVATNRPVVDAELITWIQPKGAQWSVRVDCRGQVADGVLDQLSFGIPAELAGPYEAQPQGSVETIDLLDGRRILVVDLAEPLSGAFECSLVGQLQRAAGHRLRAPRVTFHPARRLLRFVALPRQRDGKPLAWEVQGLRPAAPPTALIAPGGFGPFTLYEVTEEGFSAVVRPAPGTTQAARVLLADIYLALHADGRYWSFAAFDLEPGGATECPLWLPSGARLVHARVAGLCVAPRAVRANTWMLPLGPAQLPQRIEVVAAGRLAEEKAEPLRFQLGNLPVEHTLWTILEPQTIAPRRFFADPPAPAWLQQMVRLKSVAAVLQSGSRLVGDDPEQRLPWYERWAERLVGARRGVERELSLLAPGRQTAAAWQELRAIDAEQTALAERLGTTEILLRAVGRVPAEPQQWFRLGAGGPQRVWRYSFAGSKPALSADFPKARASGLPARLVAALVVAGLAAAMAWTWRRGTLEWVLKRLARPLLAMAGILWWLFLWPSGVGWLLVGAAGWLSLRQRLGGPRSAQGASVSVHGLE